MNGPLKTLYESIEIPEELGHVVEDAVDQACPRKKRNPLKRPLGFAAVAACLCCIILLNTSESFAQAASEIPVLKYVFQIFTFQEYTHADPAKVVNIKYPNIELNGHNALQNRINREISRLVQDGANAAEQRANEYYQAYLNTGGNPDEYIPMDIEITYEIKSQDDEYASFVIYQWETHASAYIENHFYNFDLQSGKEVTLRDMLGSDYRAVVTRAVREQLGEWDEERREYLFTDVDVYSLVNDDLGFYLNSRHQVVVVFQKYQLGVGALGQLEFVIPKPE